MLEVSSVHKTNVISALTSQFDNSLRGLRQSRSSCHLVHRLFEHQSFDSNFTLPGLSHTIAKKLGDRRNEKLLIRPLSFRSTYWIMEAISSSEEPHEWVPFLYDPLYDLSSPRLDNGFNAPIRFCLMQAIHFKTVKKYQEATLNILVFGGFESFRAGP